MFFSTRKGYIASVNFIEHIRSLSSSSGFQFYCHRRMSAAAVEEGKQKLNKVPDVDIDASGKFKYILVKVYIDDPELKDSDLYKYVVRGHADCPFHGDVYDRLINKLNGIGKGFDSECLGGGRILHETKKLKVYGYSQGYGKADHTITVGILKKHYPDYDISWSDDGY